MMIPSALVAGRRDLAVGAGRDVGVGDVARADLVPEARRAVGAGDRLAVFLTADRHEGTVGDRADRGGARARARADRQRRAAGVDPARDASAAVGRAVLALLELPLDRV